jgi:hypothetical protein
LRRQRVGYRPVKPLSKAFKCSSKGKVLATRLYITEARRVIHIDKAIHDRPDSAYIGTTATTIPGNCQTASLAGQPTMHWLQWSCTRRITHTPQRYRKLLISVQASSHAPLRTCCQPSRERLGHFLRRRLGKQASVCGVW